MDVGPRDQVKAGIQHQHKDLSRKCTVHKISILNLMPSLRDRVLAPCLFPMDTGGSSWIIKSSQEQRFHNQSGQWSPSFPYQLKIISNFNTSFFKTQVILEAHLCLQSYLLPIYTLNDILLLMVVKKITKEFILFIFLEVYLYDYLY